MAAVVGFNYCGFVVFELATTNPDLVRSIVVSSNAIKYTGAMKDKLMPESVGQLRLLFSNAVHMKS